MKMKRILLTILALALLLGLSCPAMADTLTLATSTMPGHITTESMLFFAERVTELSEGRIQVEVSDATVSGDEAAYLQQLQNGEIAFARLSLNSVKTLNADMEVFSLPYMFGSSDEMWTVLTGEIGARMLSGLNAAGLQGLGFVDAGSRSFYTTEPINTLEDFAGRKIRVQQVEPMLSMITCLGAEPVNVPAFDLTSALESGACVGAENTLSSIFGMGHHEAAKYITMDNHTSSMDAICMNLDAWNALSENDQAAIRQAMDETTAYNRDAWAASNAETEKLLTDGGAIISTPDAAVLASFREAMAPLYAQYEEKLGALIAEINTVLGR